ncbi:Fanconi anemia group G [Pelobates cultripes]|nr:Fanconi anemia group G [Pelobates cultripes]
MALSTTWDRCLHLWISENNGIIATWKLIVRNKDANILTDKQKCYHLMDQLFRKIKDLHPVKQLTSLELTVAYNLVIMHLNVELCAKEEHNQLIGGVLARVVEAHHLDCSKDGSFSRLWNTALSANCLLEHANIIQSLAGLQALIWWTQKKFQEVLNLFQSKATFPITDQFILTIVLKSWEIPDEENKNIHKVFKPSLIKDIVYAAVSFQQGVVQMAQEDYGTALDLFQEAAESCATKSLMARIFNHQGYCFMQKGLLHLALEYLKSAIQKNHKCYSAFYNSALVYKHLGRHKAEVETLFMLDCCLANPSEPVGNIDEWYYIIASDAFMEIESSSQASWVPSLSELRYLLAHNSFKYKMIDQAADYYMKLIRFLREEMNEEMSAPHVPNMAPLPPIAEILLETTECLIQSERLQEAMVVCEELIIKTKDVIPSRMIIDCAKDVDNVVNEQLNCILWTSAAHLLKAKMHALEDEPKTSITAYTSCMNLLLKVQFTNKDGVKQSISPQHKQAVISEVLKCCAFVGRSHQFLLLENLKEALQNAHLGIQTVPACPEAVECLLICLLKMDRKAEVESQWRTFKSNKSRLDGQWKSIKCSLPLFLLEYVNNKYFKNKSLMRDVRNFLDEVVKLELNFPCV